VGNFEKRLKAEMRKRNTAQRPGISALETYRRFASLIDHIPTEEELRRDFRRMTGEDGDHDS
jgi:hypothetical protein